MTPGQSLAGGAAGTALWHLEAGEWEAAYAALEHAVKGGVSVAEGASLYYGAPALAFALAGCNRPCVAQAQAVAAAGTAAVTRDRLATAHRRIDRREQPRYAEFDLIRGLTGLGVALRRIGNCELLREVLTYLVRLTQPIGELPGWWCPHGPNRDEPGPSGGHSNHGLAHGITGPLAVLALSSHDGVTVDGQAQAIIRICEWLDTWCQEGERGPWWPQWVSLTDLRSGRPSQTGPARPSWCYGTPGIARAGQLAAFATGDRHRRHRYEHALARCLADSAQLGRLADLGICHGLAGVYQTAFRAAADSDSPTIAKRLSALAALLTSHTPDPDDSRFLTGQTGVALVLECIRTGEPPRSRWDACLLIT